MKPNPPIKGHELLYEGHIQRFVDRATDEYGPFLGGCRCGEVPPEFPNVSTVKMKKWHREHKEQLRGHVVIAEYGPLYQEGHLSMYRDAWPADAQNCQVGVQVANDGRIWICINGASFLRFKPRVNVITTVMTDDRLAKLPWVKFDTPGPGEPGDASDAT